MPRADLIGNLIKTILFQWLKKYKGHVDLAASLEVRHLAPNNYHSSAPISISRSFGAYPEAYDFCILLLSVLYKYMNINSKKQLLQIMFEMAW